MPDVSIDPASADLCAGDSVLLTAAGATSYVWSTAATTSAIYATATGTYTVTGTDANGCSATASSVIASGTFSVAIDASGATSFCTGDSVILSVGLYDSYDWSTGATTSAITVTESGNYSVTVTNGGCTGSDSQSITVNENPTVTIDTSGATAFCSGDSVTLIASGADIYVWSTSGTTGSITVYSSGTYTVTGTDANGCSSTSTITVTVNALPTVGAASSPNDTVCEGSSVSLSGSGAVSYSWTGGVSDGVSFTPTATASYTVTGTDANGCTATNTATITVQQAPIVTVSPADTLVCSPAFVNLSASGASTYQWSTPSPDDVIGCDTCSSTPVSPHVNTTSGIDTTIYIVTGADANGCTATAVATITQWPDIGPPTLTFSTLCNTACIQLNPPAGGFRGTAPYTIQFTDSSGTSLGSPFIYDSTGTNQFCDLIYSGNYNAVVTDSNECSIGVGINIVLPTPFSVNCELLRNDSCNTIQGDGQIYVAVNGGSGSYTYAWSPNVSTTNVATGLLPGTYSVTVTGSDSCIATCTATIIRVGALDLAVNSSVGTLCLNNPDSVILSASGAANYEWSSGQTTSSIKVMPPATTTYTVTGWVDSCFGSRIIIVYVDSACCTDSGYAELPYSSGYIPDETYSGNYSLNRNASIEKGTTVIFSGIDLLINAAVAITVEDSATLIITENSYLHACDSMWVGIVVLKGGTLTVNAGSTISDAQYAIDARSGARMAADSATFSSNYVGIYVMPNANGNIVNSYINNCRFTCYSPLKPGYTGQYPIALTRTLAGIYVNNLQHMTIRGDQANHSYYNYFDSLNFGIRAFRSSLTIYDGEFRNIQTYDQCSLGPFSAAGNCLYRGSAAISADGNGGNFIIYKGKAFGAYNNFTNCLNGITTSRMISKISNAFMDNVGSGIGITESSSSTIRFNHISARNRGIGMSWNDGSFETTVSNNAISLGSYGNDATYGISSNEFNGANSNVHIEQNTIGIRNSKTTSGIRLYACNNYFLNRNNIFVQAGSNNMLRCNGIELMNCPNITISCSRIFGTNQTLSSSGYFGIHSWGTNSFIFSCNELDNTWEGMRFEAFSVGNLITTRFNNHNTGLNISSSGVIGEQRNHGNLWLGNYINNGASWLVSPANASLFPVYYNYGSGHAHFTNSNFGNDPVNGNSWFQPLSLPEDECDSNDCQ